MRARIQRHIGILAYWHIGVLFCSPKFLTQIKRQGASASERSETQPVPRGDPVCGVSSLINEGARLR